MVVYLTSLLLQCDVASMGIWFQAREICGHTLGDETIALPRKMENQYQATRRHIPDLPIPQSIYIEL